MLSATAFSAGAVVLGRACLQRLELKFELIKQVAAALGGLPEPVALHLGDQQLEMRHHPLGAGGPRLVDSAPNLRMTNRLMLQRELGPGSTQWLQSTESVLTALRDSENQQIRHFSAARSVGVDRGLVS